MSRSKRLCGGANATPHLPLKSGLHLTPKIQLVQTFIFFFLPADILSYHFHVPAHSRDIITSSPKFWPNKIAPLLSVNSGQMYRALLIDISNYLRYWIFRWDRYHHLNVVRHQMTFFNTAFLLRCKLVEYFTQVLAQFIIKHLATTFRNENNMIFAFPFRMA